MSWNRESKLILGVDSNCSFSLFGHRVMRLSGGCERKVCQLWARAEYSFHILRFSWPLSLDCFPHEIKPQSYIPPMIFEFIKLPYLILFLKKQVYVFNQGEKIIYWVVMGATHVLKHLQFLAIVLLSCGCLGYKRQSKKRTQCLNYL